MDKSWPSQFRKSERSCTYERRTGKEKISRDLLTFIKLVEITKMLVGREKGEEMESYIVLNFSIISEVVVVKTGVFLTTLVSSFHIYDWMFISVWNWFLQLLCFNEINELKSCLFDLIGMLIVKEIVDGFVLEIKKHSLEYCSDGGNIYKCMN